jgi:Glycine transporter
VITGEWRQARVPTSAGDSGAVDRRSRVPGNRCGDPGSGNHPLQVPFWIDLTAVVVGALAGASVAARQRLDAFGALLLAVVMGLGGGIVRDLLLGLRPAAVTSPYYLPTVAAAALAGFLFASLVRRFERTFAVLDAISVGLFTVVGVEKSLLYDLPYVSAIFIGVSAAVGGGLLVVQAGTQLLPPVTLQPGSARPSRSSWWS